MYPSNSDVCGAGSTPTPESVGEVMKHLHELALNIRAGARTVADTVGYRNNQAVAEVGKQPAGGGLLESLRELRAVLQQSDTAVGQARSVLGV